MDQLSPQQKKIVNPFTSNPDTLVTIPLQTQYKIPVTCDMERVSSDFLYLITFLWSNTQVLPQLSEALDPSIRVRLWVRSMSSKCSRNSSIILDQSFLSKDLFEGVTRPQPPPIGLQSLHEWISSFRGREDQFDFFLPWEYQKSGFSKTKDKSPIFANIPSQHHKWEPSCPSNPECPVEVLLRSLPQEDLLLVNIEMKNLSIKMPMAHLKPQTN